jgi:hypothetical protein
VQHVRRAVGTQRALRPSYARTSPPRQSAGARASRFSEPSQFIAWPSDGISDRVAAAPEANREVTALAELRHGQVNRAGAGVPWPAPVAVATVGFDHRIAYLGRAADRVRSSPITRSKNSFTISRSRSVSASSTCLRTMQDRPSLDRPQCSSSPSSFADLVEEGAVVFSLRNRHGTSRAKSDSGDAKVLADLVRTERANHCRWPAMASSPRDQTARAGPPELRVGTPGLREPLHSISGVLSGCARVSNALPRRNRLLDHPSRRS